MANSGLALIIVGGFLYGAGSGNIVPMGNLFSIAGIIILAIGLFVLFGVPRKKGKK